MEDKTSATWGSFYEVNACDDMIGVLMNFLAMPLAIDIEPARRHNERPIIVALAHDFAEIIGTHHREVDELFEGR